MLSNRSKLIAGITLITVPTIEYGGSFLLQLLSGGFGELGLTEFQRAMFRAGHAHAGVLVILALVAQLLADHARLGARLEWPLRFAFPLAAVLVSGGFFAGAAGPGVTQPTALIALLWVGATVLAAATITLGVGLLRART